ncbi:MAG: ORF6N domain-containing protein [Fibrobacteria bacterium]
MERTLADLTPIGGIESRILFLRGHKVLLDSDLADLYRIETKVLNQAVKRNPERFPSDFMFEVNDVEVEILRSQIVTSRSGWGGRRSHPYAFTEHGVAMLASVLKSERAIKVNIAIVRAFVRMREFLATHQDWLKSWRSWSRNTIQTSKWFSRQSSICWASNKPRESEKWGLIGGSLDPEYSRNPAVSNTPRSPAGPPVPDAGEIAAACRAYPFSVDYPSGISGRR